MAEFDVVFPPSMNQPPQRILDENVEEGDDYYSTESVGSTGDVLKNTFMIFGSIFAALFLCFLFFRKRFPRTYNVRNSVPEHNCALAEDTLGTLRWIYRVFLVSDEEMYDQCGLDSVVYLRMLRFGCHIAFAGMLNSIYLMPIYATSPTTVDNAGNDGFEKVTLGHIPEKDNRAFATVVAAYIIYGYAMYLLLEEFRWFTKYRHDFLSKARPDNYSVFVSGIPPEYRTDESLLKYFREVYFGAAKEAKVALNLKNIASHVAQREKIVAKLEHAINVLNVKGERPMHKVKKSSRCCGGKEKVDSIDTYTEQLEEYNEKISTTITRIEEKDDDFTEAAGDNFKNERSDSFSSANFQDAMGAMGKSEFFQDSLCSVSDLSRLEGVGMKSAGELVDESGDEELATNGSENGKAAEKKNKTIFQSGIAAAVSKTGDNVSTGVKGFTSVAKSTLLGDEDGTPKDAAFVTFSSLRARASALQQIHHETPFSMVVQEAPLPKDIFWANVGLTHKAQQLSFLLGKALTLVLCVFWAVPVTFVSSLANVDELKEQIPFLEDWIDAAPWLGDVLAQLAPLFLVVLNALLPIFLMIFAKMEGHVSTGRLMASFFTKLCLFFIVHTFFIVTVSGTIFKSIKAIAEEPAKIVDMLASSIPSQSSFFIQYTLVETFISMGLEIIRLIPIIKAWIRSKFGPNLTEKERNTPWLGLAPLSVPDEFGHAEALSDLVIYFLLLFVYSVMSPIMAFVQALAFGITGMVYRHQFMYIYEPIDSGGELWAQSVKLIIASMFIAQITLFGVLGLKKSPGAVIMLMPLVIITILFTAYIRQQHYIVTKYLPSIGAIKKEKENVANGFDYEFLRGQYKQPALQEKHVEPENMMNGTGRTSEHQFNDSLMDMKNV